MAPGEVNRTPATAVHPYLFYPAQAKSPYARPKPPQHHPDSGDPLPLLGRPLRPPGLVLRHGDRITALIAYLFTSQPSQMRTAAPPSRRRFPRAGQVLRQAPVRDRQGKPRRHQDHPRPGPPDLPGRPAIPGRPCHPHRPGRLWKLPDPHPGHPDPRYRERGGLLHPLPDRPGSGAGEDRRTLQRRQAGL